MTIDNLRMRLVPFLVVYYRDIIKMNIVKERYEIADLKLLMTTYYNKTMVQAQPYRAQKMWKEEEADIKIDFGQDFYEKVHNETLPYTGYESIEYIYTGSLFSRYLLNYNGCMLHSSAVVVDGYAYLFSADSGTGKSTHTGLWVKYFGEKAYIINDDKPILRFIDGEWYVYGTPWSGKTDLNVNEKAKLGAIVFLERSEENWIQPIDVKEAIPLFFNQTIRKMWRVEKLDLVLNYMEQILTNTPIYKMGCDISDNAVVTAYEKIRRM